MQWPVLAEVSLDSWSGGWGGRGCSQECLISVEDALVAATLALSSYPKCAEQLLSLCTLQLPIPKFPSLSVILFWRVDCLFLVLFLFHGSYTVFLVMEFFFPKIQKLLPVATSELSCIYVQHVGSSVL